MLAHRLAAGDVDQQVAAADRSRRRAAPSKRRRIADGIGAGRDHEVVFEALLVAVEDEVDAVVDAGVADARELLDADAASARGSSPMIVVDDAGQRIAAGDVARRGGRAVAADDASSRRRRSRPSTTSGSASRRSASGRRRSRRRARRSARRRRTGRRSLRSGAAAGRASRRSASAAAIEGGRPRLRLRRRERGDAGGGPILNDTHSRYQDADDRGAARQPLSHLRLSHGRIPAIRREDVVGGGHSGQRRGSLPGRRSPSPGLASAGQEIADEEQHELEHQDQDDDDLEELAAHHARSLDREAIDVVERS